MPVFKNDGLEVLAFMLDVEQDIIWQIGVCLNDEERRRAQGLGPPPLRCCPRAAAPGPRFQTGNFAVRRRTRVWAAGQPQLSHRMPASDLRFSFSRSADVAVIARDRARGRSGHRGSSSFARSGRDRSALLFRLRVRVLHRPWSGTPAGRLPPALEPAGGSLQGPGVRLGTAQVLQNGGVSNTEGLPVDVGDLPRPSPAAQTATRSTFAITAA